jgi:hypothetical protein
VTHTAIKHTVLSFTVAFEKADDPLAAHQGLVEAIRAVADVEEVEPDTPTVKCPLARMNVHIRFATSKGAYQLLDKLSKLIVEYPGAEVWSRSRILTDIHDPS